MVLYFVSCRLLGAGSIPEELGGLDKLESLFLNGNKLTGECVRACVVVLERRP